MGESKVVGIGGVFLRAKDPAALAAWYREHLGFPVTKSGQPTPDGEWSWPANGGDTVYAMFSADTDYWAAEKQAMINLRVTGIAALVERLRGAGIEVITKDEWNHPDIGSFARVHDPEGNPIELWEPPAG